MKESGRPLLAGIVRTRKWDLRDTGRGGIRKEEKGTGEIECSERLVWWEETLRLERDFGGACIPGEGKGDLTPSPPPF